MFQPLPFVYACWFDDPEPFYVAHAQRFLPCGCGSDRIPLPEDHVLLTAEEYSYLLCFDQVHEHYDASLDRLGVLAKEAGEYPWLWNNFFWKSAVLGTLAAWPRLLEVMKRQRPPPAARQAHEEVLGAARILARAAEIEAWALMRFPNGDIVSPLEDLKKGFQALHSAAESVRRSLWRWPEAEQPAVPGPPSEPVEEQPDASDGPMCDPHTAGANE